MLFRHDSSSVIAHATERCVGVHHEGFVLRLFLWSDQDVALASRAAKVRPDALISEAYSKSVMLLNSFCIGSQPLLYKKGHEMPT
jgi:hypothetical protein